jgi:regulator of sirC expression with transglutaminase-like and TPR domain
MEVAQRVGLRCEGVGYPGHFIVRCGSPERPLYIDPFHQGARIDREELLAGLRGQDLGGAAPESFLSAVTRRQLLQRMLHNLYAIFSKRGEMQRLLDVVELLLIIEPWNADLVGERGLLNYRLGNQAPALDDLERYVVATAGRASVSTVALKALDELRLQLGGSEEAR